MVSAMRRHVIALAGAALCCTLVGCGIQMPADPEGTTERVEGGTVRVGVTANPPWVDVDGSGEPGGTEPALVSGFAEQLDAELDWSVGSEAQLMQALERGELDLVIGGFHDDTPWTEKAAVTRPYTESTTAEGTAKHVMIVRMGENRFLTTLETFLFEETGS